jgi:hypothetical protein
LSHDSGARAAVDVIADFQARVEATQARVIETRARETYAPFTPGVDVSTASTPISEKVNVLTDPKDGYIDALDREATGPYLAGTLPDPGSLAQSTAHADAQFQYMLQAGTVNDQAIDTLARDTLAPFRASANASLAGNPSSEQLDAAAEAKARENVQTRAMAQAVAMDGPINPYIADPNTPSRKPSAQQASPGTKLQTVGGAFSSATQQLKEYFATTPTMAQTMVDGASEIASNAVSNLQAKASDGVPEAVKETLSKIGSSINPAHVVDPEGTIPVHAVTDADMKEDANVTESEVKEVENKTEELSVNDTGDAQLGGLERRGSAPESSPEKAVDSSEKRKSSF